MRDIAEIELTAGGQFEHVDLTAVGKSQFLGADSTREIQINAQAIRRARAQLGEGMTKADNFASGYRGMTDQILHDLLDA